MNVGELFIKLGVKDDGTLRKLNNRLTKIGDDAKEAMSKISGSAAISASAIANLANTTSKLGSSMGAAARASAAATGSLSRQANAVNALANAHGKLGRAVLSGIGANPGGSGRIGAMGGMGGLQAQRAGSAKAVLANAILDAKRMPQGAARALGRAHPALGDLGGDTFDAGALLKRKTTVNSNESHFDKIVAGLGGGFDASGASQPGGGVAQPQKSKGFVGRFREEFAKRRGGGGRGGRGGGGGGGGGSGGNRWGGAGDGVLGAGAGLRRVILGAGIIQAGQGLGQLADTYTQLQMRLDGLTGSQEKSAEVFSRLREISKSTNSSLEATTEGYVRIKNATSTMNLSEEDSFKLMENLNTILVTSGASTEEASSGMRQLTQAFAKGKLDGDEFKSIAENMPNILKELGKATGKTEGQLRAMSASGQLTRKMLVDMLLNVKGLQKPVDTFSSQWQKFKDDMIVSFGSFAKENNLVENFGAFLKVVSEVLMNYVLPALAKTFKWLKDHETVAKALVAVGLISLFGGIAKALLGFPYGILMSIADGYMKIAAAATAAKAAAAGAPGGGGGGEGAGGLAGAAGQFARRWGSRFLMNPGDLLTDAERAETLGDGPDSISGRLANGSSFDDIFSSPRTAGNGVNIDQIQVNIQASDMTDAKQKFGAEMENTLRHAAAGTGQ